MGDNDPTPPPIPTPPINQPPTPPPPQDPPPTPPTGLETALAAERRQREAAEQRAKQIQAELDAAKRGQMSEQERAVADARRQGETEAAGKFSQRLFLAEVRAAVAGKIVDPSLFDDPVISMHLLKFNEVPLNSDGNVDSEKVKKAIEEFLKDRQYLLVTTGAGAPPTNPGVTNRFGNADQGPRQQPENVDPGAMSIQDYIEWADKNDPRTVRQRNRQLPVR